MSAKNQHSELEIVRRAFPPGYAGRGLAALERLEERLEAAQERLTAYETPGWINSVQKVMEYRQHLRETWDDYAVAIDDHASEEVRREARASMLRRFSAFEDEGWLSNSATEPEAQS